MTLAGEVGNGPRNNQVYFSGDSNHHLDAEFFKISSFIVATVRQINYKGRILAITSNTKQHVDPINNYNTIIVCKNLQVY